MGSLVGFPDMITGKTIQTPFNQAEEAEIYCEFRSDLNFASHKEMMKSFEEIGKLTNRTKEDVYNETWTTWINNR
jgi:hypothetical protein